MLLRPAAAILPAWLAPALPSAAESPDPSYQFADRPGYEREPPATRPFPPCNPRTRAARPGVTHAASRAPQYIHPSPRNILLTTPEAVRASNQTVAPAP